MGAFVVQCRGLGYSWLAHLCMSQSAMSGLYIFGFLFSIFQVSLYLFRGLPLRLWKPQDDDITLVKDWLLGYELAKAENQLARLILSKMNWGYNEQVFETFG